jgi:hypothetical protein
VRAAVTDPEPVWQSFSGPSPFSGPFVPVELNRFAVGKNELPLDPDDLGFSS